jgi:hypothetical protein
VDRSYTCNTYSGPPGLFLHLSVSNLLIGSYYPVDYYYPCQWGFGRDQAQARTGSPVLAVVKQPQGVEKESPARHRTAIAVSLISLLVLAKTL